MPNNELRTRIFEQIGIQQQLFSREALREAQTAARGSSKPIADVLVELESLTKDQVRGLDRAVTYRIGRDQDKMIAKIISDTSKILE